MLSVYVVLQTFESYFCIQANSVDPDQTAPLQANSVDPDQDQSDLGPHCLRK